MQWRAAVLSLLLALVAAPALSTSQAQAPVVTTAPTFSGAAAKQQVDMLAGQIGSRPAGSPAYDQAVAYALDQLRQWGYTPVQQTFSVQVFNDRGSQVDITASSDPASTGLNVPAATLMYSIAGDVEAPLVAVGLGQPEDLAGVDVHGQIALIQRGVLRFSEKVENAAAAGAVAAIVYNDTSGSVQGALSSRAPIPATTISGDSGQQLLQLLKTGSVRVRLRVDASSDERPVSNVIADLQGSRADAATVIFTAHLDSVPAGPGANDNGSGSGVVLELARELSQRSVVDRPLTFRFALFGAEELGLDGSRYYVDNLSEPERHAIAADINLDMVGVGDSWRFGGTDDLVQMALGAANDLGQRALPLRGPLLSASDHASFLSAGMPAVFLYRVEDPNYHTAGDVASLVDPAALGQAGTIALEIADELAAN